MTVWRHPDAQEPPETSSTPPVPSDPEALAEIEPRLVATLPVIDITHIAKTIEVLTNAAQQLDRLNRLREKADIDLAALAQIPFSDPENETGRFLLTMLGLLAGGDPVTETIVEETLAYSSPDISEVFRRYFPGERILPGNGSGPSPWDLWSSEADYQTERYRAVLATLARTMDIFTHHRTQNSKERQGIKLQRFLAPSADGETQHSEMLLAALHQSLDAQSVDRQIAMLRANAELLVAAQQMDDRAAALAKDRAFLEGQGARFAEFHRLTEVPGTRISP